MRMVLRKRVTGIYEGMEALGSVGWDIVGLGLGIKSCCKENVGISFYTCA